MLYYDKIDLSVAIDFAESKNSEECIVCCYW